jgi:hypothetical protein
MKKASIDITKAVWPLVTPYDQTNAEGTQAFEIENASEVPGFHRKMLRVIQQTAAAQWVCAFTREQFA